MTEPITTISAPAVSTLLAGALPRRRFLQAAALAGMAAWTSPSAAATLRRATERMRFGLVTYQWGRDWDLPTLITNCAKAECDGVELRTTHAHRVEPALSKAERVEVRKRFADSPVTLVGIGSDERFDNPDPAVVRKAIDASKAFLELSHDVGGTGVKVKPDRFHDGVPREKTIEQIGRSLNELGKFAAGFGQQVRLEVHGQCAELPTIKAILDVADHENVGICWNSNPQDLQGEGLAHNFQLVRKRFGQTVHIHELDDEKYPWPKLFALLVQTDYDGWLLMEAASEPKDRVAALATQRKLCHELLQRSTR